MSKLLFALGISVIVMYALAYIPDTAYNFKKEAKQKANGTIDQVKNDFSSFANSFINSFSEEKTEANEITEEPVILADEANLEIHFIDVEQGDSTLIIADGHAMLIDAGYYQYGDKVTDYIDYQIGDIDYLDYVIATHPDADHVGGLSEVLATDRFGIGTVFFSPYDRDTGPMYYVEKAMNESGLIKTIPSTDSSYTLGNATFTFVGPVTTYEDSNESSLCIRLDYGSTSYLFCGDAGEKAEMDMIEAEKNLDCDVLKISHHGSKYSTCEAFLNATTPSFAVISVGESNDYFHPHATVLNQLRALDINTYRTDEQGSVMLISDGNAIQFNCAPSDSWKAGEGNWK